MLLGSAWAASAEQSQVLLLGLFHFSSPGLDKVKTEHIDVMTAENQAYLEALSERIAEFKPTAIMLEYDSKNDALLNERYQAYLEGNYVLKVNEIYQLGFRIARFANLHRVSSFDDQVIGWDAEPLFAYLESQDQATKSAFDATIEDITVQMNLAHKQKNLKQLLEMSNSQEQDRRNKDLYLLTNAVGVGVNDVGSAATASWWHRNFRMYARIQEMAKHHQRIVVIGGQGHTAILRDLLAIDDRLITEDVLPYL